MNEDKIIGMLLDHEERLVRIEENMATKADLRNMQATMDEILGVVKTTNQELIMLGQRVVRNEQKCERDMQVIKPLLGLA